MCFADIDAVMDWAMGKKGLPEVIVKAVLSLYRGAYTKVIMRSELSEK